MMCRCRLMKSKSPLLLDSCQCDSGHAPFAEEATDQFFHRFQRDIAKWSQYILQPDLELFHEIAQQLWGWVPSKKDRVVFSHEEMAEWLQRLQDVLGELVTATANTMRRERKHRNRREHRDEGRRLDVIQAENMRSSEKDEMSNSSILPGTSALVDPGGLGNGIGGTQSGDNTSDVRPKVQGEVVMLVNGAIFGVILAFLLSKYCQVTKDSC
jgi:hypothetical protein